MNATVGTFNRLVTGLFDLSMWPFRSLDPLWALTAVSLVSGFLMVWIFGKVSDQPAIRTVRDRIRGNLIGIRLFGDDPRQLFRLQGRILRDTAIYMRHALVPLLILLVPVVLILVQLNLWFAARALEPGERTVAKVTLRDGFGSPLRNEVRLTPSDGVEVETQGVRIEPLREVAWRIVGTRPGVHRLTVQIGDQSVEKELRVAGGWGPVSTLRSGRGVLENLLYPGEAPLDGDGPIEAIEIDYAALPLTLFGWNVHWLVFFFVVSVLAGVVFGRLVGIEI